MKRAIVAFMLAALLALAVTSQGLADDNDDDDGAGAGLSCPNATDIVLSVAGLPDVFRAFDLNGDGLICVDTVNEAITDNSSGGGEDDEDDDNDEDDDADEDDEDED